ncbi:galactofuranosyltransferase GlfT1 [Corynebacterium sanguinis]|uniref:galactofuranosyltransferase GlfT1 n=1 Tax=Corynebacterium sanguinis TaxID=2594913 RepID=UPI00118540E1|nr:glycosyltransferase family 2 protein [Corynebacterium sanguinis]MCT1412526.1 glycosyltransferase family 2 protein [Corynebacterium sanguinis]MCT1414916.1 glycosyltransferase family 2 protein [Corynebacterium sanguinis]MCT1443895.1 glycosyltransferase family 2 protein [Corynebacterium sanguinis]MCT1463999.1 glycosyltransferase family 2 protein [Corynebacterium sanguinis]MCT1492984.1 glycosyltransferase family 2 protein [Corynebacterium sanguinis]
MTSSLSADGTTAAVIVTHKRVDLLRHSLRQVAAQTHPVEWIIVVDNGAEPAVEELLHEVSPDKGVYLPSRTNLGGAGGFAYGFLHALALGADAVWCADDDGRPADENVLAELYRVAATHDLHQVSPIVANLDDPEKLAFPLRQGLSWKRHTSELEGDFLPQYASLFNGALISSQAMERIGVPDYRLFIRGDEVEYHRRLAQSGLRYGTALTASYLHPDGSGEFHPIMGGRAHAQWPDNPTKRYFTFRNRGYIINQRGMRKMKLQEVVRFGWFFLLQRKNPREFAQWLRLLRMGAREDFRRP